MEFKVSFKNQVNHLSRVIAIVITLIVLYFIDKTVLFDKSFDIIYILIFVVGILPALILHFNYLHIDSDKTLILKSDKIVIKKSGDTITEIETKNIKLIEIYGTETSGFPYAKYHYYKIISNDNSFVIVTSLLLTDKILINSNSKFIFAFYPLV